MLNIWRKTGRLTVPVSTEVQSFDMDGLQNTVKEMGFAASALSESLHVRHLDCGSCNAEEAELVALSNPYYDISRFGIEFVASPRHADVLAITGPLTVNLKKAMERTIEATPKPRILMAVGDGACYGTPYETGYACLGRVDQYVPIDIYVPGDPPEPEQLIRAFLACKLILSEKL
jgi:Ni,Fe-hydrogenase III small subunit